MGTLIVTKIRRGGYVFLTWAGDHSPRHVHVLCDGRLVVKWDLENWRAMEGVAVPRVVEIIKTLVTEGRL